MIKASTKRSILRWIHLIFAIPILGYIYSPFAELPSYAAITRFVFVPLAMLAGYWMYAGEVFAVIGVAVWLGAYRPPVRDCGSPESSRAIRRAKDLVVDS